MEIKILPCTCKSEFQDITYGKNKRIWNPTGDDKGWRCTVCGAVTGTASKRVKK